VTDSHGELGTSGSHHGEAASQERGTSIKDGGHARENGGLDKERARRN
jgi:hypothetical protein